LTIDPRDALIVVDVQSDLLPGGTLAASDGNRIFDPIKSLMPRFARVYATRLWHPQDHGSFVDFGGTLPAHCIAGSRGAELDKRLDQMQVDRLIDKGVEREVDDLSGFAGTDLANDLWRHGIGRVFVCGLATEYGVKATALDAKANGFDVVLLCDASAAINREPGDESVALDELYSAGIQVVEAGSLIEPAA
jgi:nicotinamidase/pyrazinamidase